MERGNRRLQYLIVSSVASSAIAVGVSVSWGTPVLPKIVNHEVGFSVTDEGMSWIMAIASIGFIIGGSTARSISDGFGRRITILGSSVPMTIGTILFILGRDALVMSAGRLLWGVATGMIVSVSAIYIAEIADKEIRGRLSLTNRFMLSFGCLLIIVVGAFVSYQALNYMMLALPIIFFTACWWIPESPYYLLKEGKTEAARKTLQMLTGIEDEDVLDEKLSQMKAQTRIEMSRSSSIKEFLTGKQYRKAILIVAGMKLPQILTGFHAIQDYLGLILVESKTKFNITTALIIFGAVRFLLGILSSVLVDRLGRRPLLVYSFTGTGLCFVTVAVYFGIQEVYGSSYPYNLIPFVSIVLARIISVLGYDSVAYLVPAELFPMNVKSIAMAVILIFSGFTNFLSVKSYQPIKDLAGLCGVFGVFSVFAFVGAVCCYFFVPETKGKSLKEIQIELNGNIYDEEEKLNKIVTNDANEVEKTDNTTT